MYKKRVEKHYQGVGDRYDRLYQKMFGDNRLKVASKLAGIISGKRHNQTIADVGGGTGATIEIIKGQVSGQHKFILVEPFPIMSEKALLKGNKPDEIFNFTAEEFVQKSAFTHSIDLMICQEMIHHVVNIKKFFEGAYNTLASGGVLVIITRPTEVEFPFGAHARATWRDSYEVNPKDMPDLLEAIGFKVQQEVYTFPITLSKKDWLEITGSEPLFSEFELMTKQERIEDLAEIQTKEDILKFNDTILFITGEKR